MPLSSSQDWPKSQAPAEGQVVEFLVWASLISSSGGRLHVFLPLLDRGLDGLLHVLPGGAWLPVQVKGSSVVASGRVWLRVRSLLPPSAWLIGCWLDGSRLGPYSLLIDGASFGSMAKPSSEGRVAVWDLDFPVSPGSASDPVSAFVVPTSSLASRLLPASLPAFELPEAVDVRSEGLLGELEVLRLLAVVPSLELYRPFPDLETAEIAVRSSSSGGVLGLQVKTTSLASASDRGVLVVKRRSFRPFPDVWVVALAWLPAQGSFHQECLFLPSSAVASVGYADGDWWAIHFHPGSTAAGRTAPYRLPLADLASAVGSRL